MQWHKIFSVAFLVLILSACKGGIEGSADTSDSTTTDKTSDTTTDSTVAISVRLLTCPSDYTELSECSETSNISSVKPGVLSVSLTQDGVGVANELVTATTTIGALSKLTALTDENGLAIFNLTDNSDEGAGRITFSTDAASLSTEEVLNFEIGVTHVSMSIDNDIGSAELAQIATSLITVSITNDDDGSPYTPSVTVTFSSACATAGTAKLDESVLAINGVAQSTYQALGCYGDDVITANASINNLSSNTTITVASSEVQSIRYIGAEPEWIAIKGTGGVDRQETSTLTFQLVDKNDLPSPQKNVVFTLSGPSGSVIEPLTAITNSDGEVSTVVSSGKVSGVVRVTAKLADSDPVISSVSDQLTISTGLPDQDSFTLSLSDFAPSAWDHNREVVTVTVSLSDHWNNTVPDGTAVYFHTEGGKIQNPTIPVGYCTTVQGACVMNWESANPRPADGRVTITAWALGEESFADKDNDGWFSDGDIFEISTSTNFNDKTDLGEVFFDYNNNNIYDELSTEEFVAFDTETNPDDQTYTAADGVFTGVLCSDDQKSKIKCAQSLIHVRMNTTLAMASDRVSCKLYNGSTEVTNTSYDLSSEGAVTLTVEVEDINGNTPPTGTTINIETLNGKLKGTTSVTTSGANINARKYQFTLANEDEPDEVTEDLLTVTMVTPKNLEEFTCGMNVIDAAAEPAP